MRQVAIVGLAPSTHDDAPYEAPDWEVRGLPWDEERWPYFDRLFDIHPLECIRKATPSFYRDGYEERLRELENPLYMQEDYVDIPNAIEYPLSEVSNLVGDYYNSSIAYMLALAIFEEYDKIGIWALTWISGVNRAMQMSTGMNDLTVNICLVLQKQKK